MFCSLARCSSEGASGVENTPPFFPDMWDLGRELGGAGGGVVFEDCK